MKHNVLSLEKSGMEASEGNEKGEYPLFTSSQIQNKFIDKVVLNGECLITGTGGFVSVRYYNRKFSASNDCLVLKKQNPIDMKFLYYQILSHLQVIDDLGFCCTTLRLLQKDFFYNMLFYLHEDKQVQTAIANYLDKTAYKIDTTINFIEEEIELLEKYKKSLIYYCCYNKGQCKEC